MTTPRDDGGPAFPIGTKEIHIDTYGGGEDVVEHGWEGGMTLRDYFAAKAMHSINIQPKINLHTSTPMWGIRACDVAERAYAIADAMLAARKETTK